MATEAPAGRFRALFKFAANNTDELSFEAGDLIRVTQEVAGGWWEGELNGVVGWFPSNYVQAGSPTSSTPVASDAEPEPAPSLAATPGPEHNQAAEVASSTAGSAAGRRMSLPSSGPQAVDLDDAERESLSLYRNFVVQQILESEKEYAGAITQAKVQLVNRIREARWLSGEDKSVIFSAFEEVVEFHTEFLSVLAQSLVADPEANNIGGMFKSRCIQLFDVHSRYAAQYPARQAALQRCRGPGSELADLLKAHEPTIVLTDALKLPLTALSKLSVLMKKLLQHTSVDHTSLDDVRAAMACLDYAAQRPAEIAAGKQMELQLCTANARAPCRRLTRWEPFTTSVELKEHGGGAAACTLLLFRRQLVVLRGGADAGGPREAVLNRDVRNITATLDPPGTIVTIDSAGATGDAGPGARRYEAETWERAETVVELVAILGAAACTTDFDSRQFRAYTPTPPFQSPDYDPSSAKAVTSPSQSKKWLFGRSGSSTRLRNAADSPRAKRDSASRKGSSGGLRRRGRAEVTPPRSMKGLRARSEASDHFEPLSPGVLSDDDDRPAASSCFSVIAGYGQSRAAGVSVVLRPPELAQPPSSSKKRSSKSPRKLQSKDYAALQAQLDDLSDQVRELRALVEA